VLHLAGDLADEMGYSLYVVGGFVRDLLLDIPNLDLDLVVEGDAIRLARKLSRRIGGQVRSHARFHTAKWLPDAGDSSLSEIGMLDFVTARTEFYEHPTALPQVERSSIKQDLHRRDFTINTLAICLNGGRYGELLDFYGGEADLRCGLIRVLHSLSFVEDPTRMLRAARLEQRLHFHIEPRTEELIAQALDMLGRTGAERLRHELYLFLAEAEPEQGLRRLAQLGVLGQIDPLLGADDWLAEHARQLRAELKRAEAPEGSDGSPFATAGYRREGLYLALLTYAMPADAADAFLERMRILKEDATMVQQTQALKGTLKELAADRLRRSDIYRLLEPYDEPALFATYVACDSWLIRQRVDLFLRRLRSVKPVTDGRALRARGLPPGPAYRQIIEALRAAWLDGELRDPAGEAAMLDSLLSDINGE
jgi:tRNA nucleotidyltransferase (CCA-adding enzyme)